MPEMVELRSEALGIQVVQFIDPPVMVRPEAEERPPMEATSTPPAKVVVETELHAFAAVRSSATVPEVVITPPVKPVPAVIEVTVPEPP